MDRDYDQLEVVPEEKYNLMLKSFDAISKYKISETFYKTFFSQKELVISKTQPVREIKTSLRRGVIIFAEYNSLDLIKEFDSSEEDLNRLIKGTKLFFNGGFKWADYFKLARNSTIPNLNAQQCHPKKMIKLLSMDLRLRQYSNALHFVNCYAYAIQIPASNRRELLLIEADLNEYLNA